MGKLIKPERSPDATTATNDRPDLEETWIEDAVAQINDTCNSRLKSRLNARTMHLRDELSAVKNQIGLASLCSSAKEVTHDGINVPVSQVTSLRETVKVIEAQRSEFEILSDEALNQIRESLRRLRQQPTSLDTENNSAREEWAGIYPYLLEPNIYDRIDAAKKRMAKISADRKLVLGELVTMVEDAVEHRLQGFEQATGFKGILTSNGYTVTKHDLPCDHGHVPKRQRIESVPSAPAQDLPPTYIVYPRHNSLTIKKMFGSKTIILNDKEIQMLGQSGYSILLLLDQEDGNFKDLHTGATQIQG